MPQKSSIEKQAPEIREAIDKAIRENRATIDEVHEMALEMGADVSRSAVGRYKKSAEEQMRKWREANEISKIWVGKLEESGDSEMDRMLAEMLKTVAFQTLNSMGDDEENPTKPGDIMFLAKGLKELAGAEKLTVERISKIRQETAEKAAEKAEEAGRQAGLSDDGVKSMRQAIMEAL